jgi:hypothetical protein
MQPVAEDVIQLLEAMASKGLIEIGLDDKGIEFEAQKWIDELNG